jgi:hypothetical protein
MKSPQKKTLTAVFFAGLLYANWAIFSPLFISAPNAPKQQAQGDASVVREENGKQIIHIVAGHGYNPRLVAAKANVPTVLEMELGAGYDCSAGLRIPALKVQEFLKTDGLTLITVPPQEAGSTLTGLCSMGMYKFDIKFS